jgi:uncharacterized protein Yka (UPF0111/DUF47 family)
MGFIRDFLLPREVDFNASMLSQAAVARAMVELLFRLCDEHGQNLLEAIDRKAEEAHRLKDRNMKELLDVFITPYDRESIYRMITQLDWISLSVRHFRLEVEFYHAPPLQGHQSIVSLIREMARTLEDGLERLGKDSLENLGRQIDRIRELYDEVVSHCARAAGELDPAMDCKQLLHQRDMLFQLKEVAKRIHVAANTLEDMAIKVM